MPRIIIDRKKARAARRRGRGSEGRDSSSRLRPLMAHAALALFSAALTAPSYAAAGENEDIADLRRMVRELQAQNRELSRRLGALEGVPPTATLHTRPAEAQERPTPPIRRPAEAQARSPPAGAEGRPPPGPIEPIYGPVVASPRPALPLPEPRDTSGLGLEQRVAELEVGWAAQEHATRQIIQNTLSKIGPKINSFLALSGVIEVLGSRSRDFYGPTRDELHLSTVELDFDIKLSEWLTGALVLGFDRGTGTTFPTSQAVFAQGVDRFTLDRTHISIGNLMEFPIAARAGRETLHFGSSTGVARLDNLSIGTPLTQEVFENRQTAVGLEFALPTPPLRPPPAPVVIPPVQPLVIAPLVRTFAQWLGYSPLPQRAIRPVPVTPPLTPPPFYGSIAMYKGSELIQPNRTLIQDFNASLGYRTEGHCGVPYEELWSSLVCPWAVDVHVDYNSSVFDSKFLEATYQPFRIGRVPGMAATAKASFGPFALIGEVNSALTDVTFFDGLGTLKNVTPMTWQVSLAYQFGWNPWVTEIGQQGNFIAVGYSNSQDVAGAIDVIGGVPTRVGFVPKNRLLVTAGEWPMDGLKVALEYAANWDYPQSSGGTGRFEQGIFGLLALNF